jgi:hypothetical protein
MHTPVKLKLGKGAAFVKTRLRRLPLTDDVWEVDFQHILETEKGGNRQPSRWLGMVLSQTDDFLFSLEILDTPATVNDLAKLLAEAMRRPLTGPAHRPSCIHLRSNPLWQELLPHLLELKIDVLAAENLPKWAKVKADYVRDLKAQEAKKTQATTLNAGEIDEAFPAIADWVRTQGWIEIGECDWEGFIVRALHAGGMVFEDNESKTLGEALKALERGIEEL